MQSERIQKVLSQKGIMSRRATERAIQEGRVKVNGRPARIGHPINVKKDIITIDGNRIYFEKHIRNVYIMLNKPRGFITTTRDSRGRKTVMDLLDGVDKRVYPIGRLDMNSEGLLLFTNDGEFANAIMHPSGRVSKTYRVTVRGKVTEEKLIELATGIRLDDGYVTEPAGIHVLVEEPERTVLQFTVFEGRNHLIRRMCKAAGLEVTRLKRLAVGPVTLGMLQPGSHRELTSEEVNALKASVKKAQNRSKQEGR